jgi:hypothetical protein
LLCCAQALAAAAASLPSELDGTAAAKTRAVQATLATFVGDIDAKTATLAQLNASLQTLLGPALLLEGIASKSQARLDAVEGVAGTLLNTTLPGFAALLRGLQRSYETAAPYMVRMGQPALVFPVNLLCML